MLAVVEDLDRFAGKNGLGKFEQRHVRPAPRAIYGEEAQTCSRQTVEMAIGMRHQFVGFFACGVKTQRMVDVLVDRKGHGSIGAIDTGTAGIDKVLDAVVATTFEDVGKADDIAVDVGERVLDGVAHACLGSEVNHSLRLMGGEAVFHRLAVGKVDAQVGVVRVLGMSRQSRFLDRRVVIVVVIIDADNRIDGS